jgi:hypothetical protein
MTGPRRKMNIMQIAENAHQIRTSKSLTIREVVGAAPDSGRA